MQRARADAKARLFGVWRDNVATIRRQRKVITSIAFRWQHQGLMACFRTWAANAHQQRLDKQLARRVLSRAANLVLSKGFARFVTVTNAVAAEQAAVAAEQATIAAEQAAADAEAELVTDTHHSQAASVLASCHSHKPPPTETDSPPIELQRAQRHAGLAQVDEVKRQAEAAVEAARLAAETAAMTSEQRIMRAAAYMARRRLLTKHFRAFVQHRYTQYLMPPPRRLSLTRHTSPLATTALVSSVTNCV